MKDVSALGLNQPPIGAQDVGELQSPEIVKLRPAKQAVDQMAAPKVRSIGQELATLEGVGNTPMTSR